MERIALHTRLKPGRDSEYEEVHTTIPAELDAAMRAAGVHAWRIRRDGRDLFHLVNVPWQARMAELLEVEDDYSGTDFGVAPVGELP